MQQHQVRAMQMNQRPSPSAGPQPPPPYRAPPPLYTGQPQTPTPGASAAFSKFNVSEPNIMAGQQQQQQRHTINHDNSAQVQHNLRNMLGPTGSSGSGGVKHSTLDGPGQNMMLQHLRNSGINGNPSYASPDTLRDAASRIFTRNHGERSSFGGLANMSVTQQFQMQNALGMNPTPPATAGGGGHPRLNQSVDNNDATKRHSFTNQSFRKALEQQNQKVPPQVPPKPNSRSTSRELLLNGGPNSFTVTDGNANGAGGGGGDNLDAELKNILRGGHNVNGHQRLSMGNGSGTTPPLPALSPGPGILHMLENGMANGASPDLKSLHHHNKTGKRPDLLDDTDKKANSMSNLKRSSKDENLHLTRVGKTPTGRTPNNMTPGALDLEKVMTAAISDETSDDGAVSTAIDIRDAEAIRSQLDGLENMYGEVLKLLGLRKFGRSPHHHGGHHVGPGGGGGGLSRKNKMYGSMSSLPSVSSIGSRHLYGKGHKGHSKIGGLDGKTKSGNHIGGAREHKTNNKRFQRLESHVVTLARSVAHLSSEVRSQQLILQEVEALRAEVHQLRLGGGGHAHVGGPGQGGHIGGPGGVNGKSFLHSPVSPQHANRVKKLTKFFGDEPPLLRLFLKNLGYEKYASLFEEAKIGMLELPYLSEDRLEKLGVPMGPRMRILQESRTSLQTAMPPAATTSTLTKAGVPLSLVNTTAATAGGSGGGGGHPGGHEQGNYNVYIL